MKEVNNKNELYPIFLKLSSLKLLIVGGGNVALEKLNSILSNSPNANILLIAPDIKTEIQSLVNEFPSLRLEKRKFQDADILAKDLIICATDDKILHAHIKEIATNQNLLVNVADTPDLCDFYLSSIVQKGNLKIGISTNGLSPTGAKRIKEALQDALPDTLDNILLKLNAIRNNLKGDFEYKIKKMNEVTFLLGLNHDQVIKRNVNAWIRKFAFVLALVLLGFALGKLI